MGNGKRLNIIIVLFFEVGNGKRIYYIDLFFSEVRNGQRKTGIGGRRGLRRMSWGVPAADSATCLLLPVVWHRRCCCCCRCRACRAWGSSSMAAAAATWMCAGESCRIKGSSSGESLRIQ